MSIFGLIRRRRARVLGKTSHARRLKIERLAERRLFTADFDFATDNVLGGEPHGGFAYFSRAVPSPSLVGTQLLAPAGGTRVMEPNNGGFKIEIVPGLGLRNQFGALAAVHRAAAQWEAHIFDPITVTVHIDAYVPERTDPLFGALGFAMPVEVQLPYSTVRGAMMNDGLTEGDDSIIASLPAVNDLEVALPPGFVFENHIAMTKANLKALDLHTDAFDDALGVSDGRIALNASQPFDFNRADGIEPGKFDFESVVVHELGHILGFISSVDRIDQTPATEARPVAIAPTTLDLFRFRSLAGPHNPRTPAAFSTIRRELRPSTPAVFDFVLQDGWTTLANEYAMELGEDFELIAPRAAFGYQASHWQDEDLFGRPIGVMGPVLGQRIIAPISNVDLRAFDLIGFDILPPGVAAAAPVLEDDVVAQAVTGRTVIDVLANDRNNTRPLVLSTFRIVEAPAGGEVIYDVFTGLVVYEPNRGFSGDDVFTYTIADDRGLFAVPAVVSLNVIRSGAAPFAVDDFVLTRQDRSVLINPLINDSDADSVLSLERLRVSRGPANGSITREVTTQRLIYTPNAAFVGEDTFDYVISDDEGNESSATVRITVGQVLPPNVTPGIPVALLQRVDVNGDQQVSAIDALMVINYMSRRQRSGNATASTAVWERFDVNRDGMVTALDALQVINAASRQTRTRAFVGLPLEDDDEEAER